MAYILQTDSYTCGPVAIINADIWKNGSSGIDVTDLSKKCGTNELRGTERWDLNLTTLGISQKPTYNISTIKEEIELGNSAIILISFRERHNSVGAHYIFVEKGEDGNKLISHNSHIDSGGTYQDQCYQDWEVLYEELLRCNPNDEMGLFYPCEWIVRNEN